MIKKSNAYRKMLLGYWSLFVGAVVLYCMSMVWVSGKDFATLLREDYRAPIIVLSLFWTVVHLGLFYKISQTTQHTDEHKVILYSILFQQLCMHNVIGVGLLFMYIKRNIFPKRVTWKHVSGVTKGLAILMGLFSLLLLFVFVRLLGVIG